MKLKVTFKDPGALDMLSEEEKAEFRTLLSKYIEFNEYVTIEFDSEAKTVRVLPVKY